MKTSEMTRIFRKCLIALAFTTLTPFISTLHSQTTLKVRVNSAADDLEEYMSTITLDVGLTAGSYDIGSSDLELGQENATTNAQLCGMRFNNVSIPQGAYIISAKINFTVDATNKNTNPSNLVILGEAADNSAAFSTVSAFNLSSRTKVADTVAMTFPISSWSTVGTVESTSDIRTIIQTIVNRTGWQSGNSMSLFVKGSGVREAEAYDGSASQAAELEVVYGVTSTASFRVNASADDAEESGPNATSGIGAMDLTSSDIELVNDGARGSQYVGLRFKNISVTKNALITSAYIQFAVDETVSTTGDKIFKGEAVDNSSAFTTTAFNISTRPLTTDSVVWTGIPAWSTLQAAGVDQRSPNLKAIVQSIVNRSGWSAGNSLNIIIKGSGQRVAEAFDGSAPEAPLLVITYIPNVAPTGDFPIDTNTIWAFKDQDSTLPATWKNVSYNDTAWPFGLAQFGYGDGDEVTPISFGPNASNKFKTAYFRHRFNIADASVYDSLRFGLLRDDGAVVYLNGTEIFRSNLPSGSISYSTLATGDVSGAAENQYQVFKIDNTLVNGLNYIAVEVHQSSASSPDLSFNLSVEGILPPAPVSDFPIVKGDIWSYKDNGSNQDTLWRMPSFNYYGWKYAKGQLGYGDADEATVISYGPNPNNKYRTTYFIKEFKVDTTGLRDSVAVGLMRDDGAIVYLNGQELFRSNMPTGTVNYQSFASTAIGGTDETTYFLYKFPKSILLSDTNYIAVEIHQSDSASSDLSFDLYMQELPDPPVEASGCTQGNMNHISCFTSISAGAQVGSLRIPETHAYQVIFRQGDAYGNFAGTAPGNHDFTGYVPVNGSSEIGYINVNHETGPGGVSVLDVHYDSTDRVWITDSISRVDLYNSDLVTTNRNCSGAVTPWGTTLSSEEVYNTGDANADGYHDVGWNFEVDPVTRRVPNYGTSKQEKLWAMGRMSHENVVVANDSITAYEGEDGGSSGVYKFIANNPADLSSGTLYVLKLTAGLTGGEPNGKVGSWIQVPNTTVSDRNSTSSLIAALGGTNFNGVEDVEIHPITGQIYFTSKNHSRIYRFTDDGSTVSDFETFCGGTSYTFIKNGVSVTEPWGSGNDNLAFDDLGNLWVLQDGSRNYMWMIRPEHEQVNPHVELFMSPPAGSEPTGATFSPDYRFMFVSIQHPSGTNGVQTDAAGNTYGMNTNMTLVVARKEHLGIYSPDAQAAQTSIDDVKDCKSLELNWKAGNGDGRIVVARETATARIHPSDGHYYNPSTVFGNGDTTGGGNFVVYDGPGESADISGLILGKSYEFDVYEYRVLANLPFYNTLNPAGKSFAFGSIPPMTISGRSPVEVKNVEVYSVNPVTGFKYYWTVSGGNIIAGQATSSIAVMWTAKGQGSVQVLAVTGQGCAGSPVTTSVNVENYTGMSENGSGNDIRIYPNPSSGLTTIESDIAYENARLEIYNQQGALVAVEITGNASRFEFDAAKLKAGTYMVRLSHKSGMINRLLVVK